jgi:hypothetical protein
MFRLEIREAPSSWCSMRSGERWQLRHIAIAHLTVSAANMRGEAKPVAKILPTCAPATLAGFFRSSSRACRPGAPSKHCVVNVSNGSKAGTNQLGEQRPRH